MPLEKDMEKWLRRELTKERTSDGAVTKIVLRHAAAGSKGSEVESMDLPVTFQVDDLPNIVDEIVSRAQTDADGQGGIGMQRYVASLHIKGERTSVGRFPFRLKGAGDEFEDAGDEPANMRGMMTQFMRHNEAMARTMIQSVQGITMTMARRLESADVTIAKLTESAQRNIQILEEARSEQHTRDLELLQAETKSKREDQIFEKVSLLVPVVINKLAGQKVFNAEDPSAIMLRSFAESMSAEQFAQIRAALNQEQTLLLMQIMQNTQKQLPAAK